MEETPGMPGQSPLASFLEHPKFQQAAGHSHFQIWVLKGMSQFHKLGKDVSMHSSEQMVQTMGNSPIIRFQIAQLRDLVRELTVNEQ